MNSQIGLSDKILSVLYANILLSISPPLDVVPEATISFPSLVKAGELSIVFTGMSTCFNGVIVEPMSSTGIVALYEYNLSPSIDGIYSILSFKTGFLYPPPDVTVAYQYKL